MTATDVARATRPYLWQGRNTRWGDEAWTQHLELVTTVLETADHQATAADRAGVLAEAVALLDAGGWHDAAEHLREEAGLTDPEVQETTQRPLRAVREET